MSNDCSRIDEFHPCKSLINQDHLSGVQRAPPGIVMTALGVIRERLPFLIDLTTAEHVILPKLGDKTQPFVRKAVDIALQHPELLPAGFLDEMRKDAQLLEGLSPIRLAIDLLQKRSMIRSFRSAPRLTRQHERCMP